MDKERPSPTKSATLYNVGTIKTGNDGNKYIIVENKNGVKKWQKYKKDRPSPSKSATLYTVGTIKKGNDGNKYIIVENKNGVKKWQKYKNVSNKKENLETKKESKKVSKKVSKKQFSPLLFFNLKVIDEKDFKKIASKNETYKILITKVIPEINKLKIKTFLVPSPLSDNDIYWNDYPPHYIKEKYNEDIYNINHMYFVFYMNKNGDEIIYDKPINISYSTLTKENKINIINIFEKHLFGQYSWNGSNNITMTVSFYENKNIKKINTKLIKDNDYYPQLNIYINTNINLKDSPLILNKLINYLQKTCEPSYDVLYDFGRYDIHFTIYLLDNKKIIEKIKNYIKKQIYILESQFYFSELKNSDLKEENIWSYKK
jgi:hypothetical protein